MSLVDIIDDIPVEPRPRNGREWYETYSVEDRAYIRKLLTTYPAAQVQRALAARTDWPFEITALKNLRDYLKENLDA